MEEKMEIKEKTVVVGAMANQGDMYFINNDVMANKEHQRTISLQSTAFPAPGHCHRAIVERIGSLL